jgi:alpha-N-arabinofuranosidase
MRDGKRLRPSTWAVVLAVSIFYNGFAGTAYSWSSENLLKNGDFEIPPTSPDFGWLGNPSRLEGSLVLSPDNRQSGNSSLKLIPTALNNGNTRSGTLFGVGQAVPITGFAGQPLYVSGWLQAEGGSSALLQVYALWKNGQVTLQELRQKPAPTTVRRRDIFIVPKDAAYIVALCLVEGTNGAAYFDDVRLSVGLPDDWPEATGAPNSDTVLTAEIAVNPRIQIRHIPATLYGTNIEWIWNGDGIWDTKTERLNNSIVSLTRGMGATLHRFPGGVFADFYNWKDGVGPVFLRPTNESMPGGPVSFHRFGTDEALEFAEATNAQLLLTVNVVTGTPEEAADWVKYVNNGGRRVEYWEIGNESYVAGSSVSPASVLTPEEYVKRFKLFARAMRAVDPTIKIGAIADENYTRAISPFFADWTSQLLTTAPDEIDFIAVHCGYAPALWDDKGWDPRTVYAAMTAAPQLIHEHLADLAARIEATAPNRDIRIAVTEWGPFFQFSMDSRFVDHTKTLGSSLFVAGALKAFIESPRADIANLFKLTDAGFMGWIGMRQETPEPKATALALQMFTRHFGTDLVWSKTDSPTYDSPAVGWVDAAQTPYLDAIASTDADQKYLYIIVINRNFDAAVHCTLSVGGYNIDPDAQVFTLDGTALDSNTGTEPMQVPGFAWAKQAEVQPFSRFYSGGPDEVLILESLLHQAGSTFDYVFPPHSTTALVLSMHTPSAAN